MNIVLVVIDTLRYDHVGANGNTWIHTPSLDALARRAVTFDRAFANSFPTIPNRTDTITARDAPLAGFTGLGAAPLQPLAFHPWAPLAWGLPTVPGLLRQSGCVTMLLADNQHLINHGYGFDRPFHGWDLIRGQEVDRISTAPMRREDVPGDPSIWSGPLREPSPPFPAATPEELRWVNPGTRQYFRNRAAAPPREESDYLPARLFQTATRWLEANAAHEQFFLWIDSFDPHEPWDPPMADRKLYDPSDGGIDAWNPPGNANKLTAEQRRRLDALYCGEITLVDRWLGRFLDRIDQLGLGDKTAVIVTADHGTWAGNHGRYHKGFPLLDDIAHVPLFVKLPGDAHAGTRLSALVQPADVGRTILDVAGVTPDWPVHGRSLLPLIRGEQTANREVALSGGGLTSVPQPISVNDGRWLLVAAPDRTDWLLFDNEADPGQLRNVVAEAPDQARRLHEALVAELQSRGADPMLVRLYAEARVGGPAPDVAERLAALAAATPRYDQHDNVYYL